MKTAFAIDVIHEPSIIAGLCNRCSRQAVLIRLETRIVGADRLGAMSVCRECVADFFQEMEG